eukprot:TRINITY_DN813_c0_g1_i1.p1 TRINITY_DN813_c0_g1~~TRINITY_DN813_c0_g1_i1.p1  ORF type:complete len:172 (+),score=19.58 TRINITY_DN813_c0_g1_i1:35-517(+)
MMLFLRLPCKQTQSFATKRNFTTSSIVCNSKETRQAKYVQMLRDLGYNYEGPLSMAKTTLNKFLKHDALLVGLKEVGNGNNRNLMDRLVPRFMNECNKYNLPDDGDYVALRNRLRPILFQTSVSFDAPENYTRTEPLVAATQETKKAKKVKKKKEKVNLV